MTQSSIPTGQSPDAPDVKKDQFLKLALEMGPIGLFLITYFKLGALLAGMIPAFEGMDPILIATAVFMVATVISLVVSRMKFGKLPVMPLVSGVVLLVFGGLALYLQDEIFIKMKPTIVNSLFGIVLLVGLVFRKNLLSYVFDAAFSLTDEGWRKLTLRWGIFFFVLAIINEIVWRNFSKDFWVSFKFFGFVPITMVFTLMQMPLIEKYSLDQEKRADS